MLKISIYDHATTCSNTSHIACTVSYYRACVNFCHAWKLFHLTGDKVFAYFAYCSHGCLTPLSKNNKFSMRKFYHGNFIIIKDLRGCLQFSQQLAGGFPRFSSPLNQRSFPKYSMYFRKRSMKTADNIKTRARNKKPRQNQIFFRRSNRI